MNTANDEIERAVARFGGRTEKLTRIAFGDADDPRIREAVTFLAREQFIAPVVVAPPGGTLLPSDVECVDPASSVWSRTVFDALLERPYGRHGEESARASLTGDSLLYMALGVGVGMAEAGIAGSSSTSANVIRAGLRGLGVAPGSDLACGAFVLGVGDDLWTWADCSVMPNPTSEQLASIAIAAATLHEEVSGDDPKVAMLSFSTAGSADHPDADKVRSALNFVHRQRPELNVDGEMQFDAAVDLEVGARKFPGSTVAGRANVFVFPDLDSANVSYKVAQRVGKARIMGSFVLGLSRPWVDLSRGCSVPEIVSTALALRSVINFRNDVGIRDAQTVGDR